MFNKKYLPVSFLQRQSYACLSLLYRQSPNLKDIIWVKFRGAVFLDWIWLWSLLLLFQTQRKNICVWKFVFPLFVSLFLPALVSLCISISQLLQYYYCQKKTITEDWFEKIKVSLQGSRFELFIILLDKSIKFVVLSISLLAIYFSFWYSCSLPRLWF